MMMILRWVVNAAALLGIAHVVPGFVVDDIWSAVWGALAIGLINAILRPLLKVLTFPITILTLGLFSIVLNALLLWLASTLISGFDIQNFFAAVLGAILLWIVSQIVDWLLKGK